MRPDSSRGHHVLNRVLNRGQGGSAAVERCLQVRAERDGMGHEVGPSRRHGAREVPAAAVADDRHSAARPRVKGGDAPLHALARPLRVVGVQDKVADRWAVPNSPQPTGERAERVWSPPPKPGARTHAAPVAPGSAFRSAPWPRWSATPGSTPDRGHRGIGRARYRRPRAQTPSPSASRACCGRPASPRAGGSRDP